MRHCYCAAKFVRSRDTFGKLHSDVRSVSHRQIAMNQPASNPDSRRSRWSVKLRRGAAASKSAGQPEPANPPVAIVTEGIRLKAQAAVASYDLGEYSKMIQWLGNGGMGGLDRQTILSWVSELESQRKLAPATSLLESLIEHEKSNGTDPSNSYFQLARIYRLRADRDSFVESVLCCLESGNCPNVLTILASMKRPGLREPLLANIERLRCKVGEKNFDQERLLFAMGDIYRLNGDFANAAQCVGKVRDGRTTKGKKKLLNYEPLRPAFLIIGSTKSGTTGMYHTLCQHPNVFAALRKEIRYFGRPDASLDWYLAHFPRLPAKRGWVTGEATPNYYMHDVQQQVNRTLPGVKLICMLRNPADRAVSQYFHSLKLGSMRQPLEKFFDPDELAQLSKKSDAQLEEIAWACRSRNFKWNNCLVAGLYHYYLRRWFEVFGDQLLLVTMEDFRKNHNATVNRVLDFLELKRHGLPLTNQYSGNYRKSDPVVFEQVRQRLAEFYEPHNRRLADEFGVNF